MPKVPGDIFYPLRGAGLRGSHYVRHFRGQEVIARWPKPRGKARSAAQQQAQDDFAGACIIIKNMDPLAQAFAAAVAEDAPLLPRDILMWQLFGQAIYFVMPDGRKVFSMAAMQDVSLLLDSIWQQKGGILYRDGTLWKGLKAGTAGQYLRIDPATGLPAYGDLPPPPHGAIGARIARDTGTQSVAVGNVTMTATTYADTGFTTNPSAGTITVPETGFYNVTAHVRLQSGSTPTFSFLAVTQNGNFTGVASRRDGQQWTDDGLSGMLKCAAGDVLAVQMNSGGAAVLISNNGVVANSVWFAATMV